MWVAVRIIFFLLISNSIVMAGEAVSEINGKLDFFFGSMESDDSKSVSGSIGLPLGENIGMQVDGLYTRVSGRDFYGGGTHLFWRDPSKGLLGITGAGVYEEDMYSLQGDWKPNTT